jgi:cyanate permease
MGAGTAAIATYLPLFAHEDVGFTVTGAGAVVSAAAVLGVGSRLAWAELTERARHVTTVLVWLAGASAAGTALLAAAATPTPLARTLLWAGAVVYALSTVGWIAAGMLVIVREADADVAGRVSGLVLGCFYAGFASSPVAFGHLVDRTGTYAWSWLVTSAAFVVAGLSTLGWRRRGQPATAPELAHG